MARCPVTLKHLCRRELRLPWSRRLASLRLSEHKDSGLWPFLFGLHPSRPSIRAAHNGPGASAPLRTGERFSLHAFVRITPRHEENRRKAGRFLPCAAIYAMHESLSRPILRTYSAEVTSLSRAISRIIAMRPHRRSIIVQQSLLQSQALFSAGFKFFQWHSSPTRSCACAF